MQAKSDDPKDTKTTTQDKKEETVGDLKKSEEFRKFKANPSIEAALKVLRPKSRVKLWRNYERNQGPSTLSDVSSFSY